MKREKHNSITKVVLMVVLFLYFVYESGFVIVGISNMCWENCILQIIDIREYGFSLRGDEEVYLRKAIVSYKVDGKTYNSMVLAAYCEEEGDNIGVSISKINPRIVIRNKLLPLSIQAVAFLGIDIVLIIICIIEDIIVLVTSKKKPSIVTLSVTEQDSEK